MKINKNYLCSAIALLIIGYLVGKSGHEYRPVQPQVNKESGTVELEYKQVNPGQSKFISILFALGAMYCVSKAIEKEEEMVVHAQTNSIQQLQTAQAIVNSSSSTYFEETDEEDEDSVELPVVAKKTKIPVFVSDNFDPSMIENISPKKTGIKQWQPQAWLPDIILQHTLHGNKHLLICSLSGSGKTTFLGYMMKHLYVEFNGQIDYLCSSAKLDTWLGIHALNGIDGQPMLLSVAMENEIPMLADRMVYVKSKTQQRQKLLTEKKAQGETINFTPLIVVMDEWQISKDLIADYDRNNKTNYLNIIMSVMLFIICTGRETGVILWAFGQSHQVQNLGPVFNEGIQPNLGTIVLGSQKMPISIEAATSDPKFCKTKTRRESLWAEAQEAIKDPKTYIAYCNIGGHRILGVPYIEHKEFAKLRLIEETESQKPEQPNNIVPFKTKIESPEIEDYWHKEA